MDTAKLDEIMKSNGNAQADPICILNDIQVQHNYFPEERLRHVARKFDMPLVDLYSIASFYHAFGLTPQVKHLVQCCLETACHLHGSHRVLNELERKLDVQAGEATEDKLFILKTVNCLGVCAICVRLWLQMQTIMAISVFKKLASYFPNMIIKTIISMRKTVDKCYPFKGLQSLKGSGWILFERKIKVIK